jgi:hypothetical protein
MGGSGNELGREILETERFGSELEVQIYSRTIPSRTRIGELKTLPSPPTTAPALIESFLGTADHPSPNISTPGQSHDLKDDAASASKNEISIRLVRNR